MTEFEKRCVDILDAMNGSGPLVSCQGQGMDGFSALAHFVGLTKKLKAEDAEKFVDLVMPADRCCSTCGKKGLNEECGRACNESNGFIFWKRRAG